MTLKCNYLIHGSNNLCGDCCNEEACPTRNENTSMVKALVSMFKGILQKGRRAVLPTPLKRIVKNSPYFQVNSPEKALYI